MCQLFQACRLCFNMIGIRFSRIKRRRPHVWKSHIRHNYKRQPARGYGPAGFFARHGRGSVVKQPTGRDFARVLFLGLLVLPIAITPPLVVSLIGPVYFGYSHAPYWRVLAWALASTTCFFWWGGTSAFKTAFTGEAATLPFWIKLMNVVLIITWATLGIVAGHSLAYVLVRSISN
jgi:hypothetical protein